MLILILIIWIWNRLNLYFIKESCVRSIDRDQAQKHLTEALQLLQSKYTFDAIAKGKKNINNILYNTNTNTNTFIRIGLGRTDSNCDWVRFYNSQSNPAKPPPKMRRTM